MDGPNQSQIAGQLRTALAAGGPIAAFILSKTGWASADYSMYLEMALYVLPPLIAAVWSYIAKRSDNLVRAASTVQGATVVTDETASASVKAVSANAAYPDVKTEKQYLSDQALNQANDRAVREILGLNR